MKKTFLFTVLTIALILFTAVGCKKEVGFEIKIPNKPNLTIENVDGPNIEDCGGFKWDVKFNLNEASKSGGWIVQKINYKRNVIDCPIHLFLITILLIGKPGG